MPLLKILDFLAPLKNVWIENFAPLRLPKKALNQ